MSLLDLYIGVGIGFLMGASPFLSLLIVTRGHVKFFDSRKHMAIKRAFSK